MKTRASILNLLFATFFISFAGCTKEVERGFPRVKTVKPLYINESEVILRGEITNYKSVDFQEYGFIFGDSVFGEDNNLEVINLGIKPGSEQFESVFPGVIEPGTAYYYAAYAIANDILSVGSEESFNSYNCIPEITGLSSTELGIGSDLIIYGNNFSPVASQNTVRIGSIEIIPKSATATQLIINIDQRVSSGSYNISVKTCGEYVNSIDAITITNTQWERVADFPGGESYKSTSFSIGEYGYAGLGNRIDHDYFRQFWRYDPSSNLWTPIQDFPGNTRILANSFSFEEVAYIGGGYTLDSPAREALYDYYKFDPSSNNWTRIADFPFQADRLYCGWFTSSGNYGYFTTSIETMSIFSKTSEEWSYVNSIPAILTGASSFEINNSIYIVDYNNNVWTYDTANSSWSQKSSFPGNRRYSGVGFSINGKGYFGMGKDDNKIFYNDIWEYSPTSDQWLKQSDLPDNGRSSSFVFVLNNNAYIGGGLNNNYKLEKKVYRFTPSN